MWSKTEEYAARETGNKRRRPVQSNKECVDLRLVKSCRQNQGEEVDSECEFHRSCLPKKHLNPLAGQGIPRKSHPAGYLTVRALPMAINRRYRQISRDHFWTLRSGVMYINRQWTEQFGFSVMCSNCMYGVSLTCPLFRFQKIIHSQLQPQ
jgi:hypothetical protein